MKQSEGRNFRRRRALVVAPLAITALHMGAGRAQMLPGKPIRLVAGHPPGGQADVIARIVSPRLAEILDQPVVNENRPGAAGLIAAALVAKSPPDGRTLLISSSSNLALARVMVSDPALDPLRDFALLGRVAIVPTVLVVGSWVPVATVGELIDYAKARPGRLTAGSSGQGSTSGFSLEMLKAAAGIDILQVPYGGLAPAVTGLLGRQIDLVFSDYALIAPHVKSGAVRVLATPASRRFVAIPDAPTLKEQGLAAVTVDACVGIAGPAGLPNDVYSRLAAAIGDAIRTAALRQHLLDAGFEPFDDTPAQYAAALADDIARFSAVARRLGIRVPGAATVGRL